MTARILLLLAASFALSFQVAQAEVKTTARQPQALSALPFGDVVPRPGALSVSPDGSIAAHIKSNGDVLIWDLATSKPLDTIPADGRQPSALALSPDPDQIAIGYIDSRVVLRSRKAGKPLREFNGHLSEITALAFSPDGQLLVSGAADATSQVWQVGSGRRLHVFDSTWNRELSGDAGYPVAFGFTGDGQVLVVNEWHIGHYTVERSSSLWNLGSGMEISTRKLSSPSMDNFMRAGQALGGWLLAYTGTQHVMFERLDRCDKPLPLPAEGYADTVATDPQGRWVATTEPDKITFFAPGSKGKGITIPLPAKAIALSPSPDGRSLFALLLKEAKLGDENFVFGSDAYAAKRGILYRIALPEVLLRQTPLALPEGATHCPVTDALRAPQDFRLPEKAPTLALLARLAPTQEMKTEPDPADKTGPVQRVSPISELHFGEDGRLFALHKTDSGDHSPSGVAVWSPASGRLLQARFKRWPGLDGAPVRMREGWALETQKQLSVALTGRLLMQTPDSLSSQIDINTGEIFVSREGGFDRFKADGKRLPGIKTKSKVSSFAARNGRLLALHENGMLSLWNLGQGEKPQTFKLISGHYDIMFAYGLQLSADGRFLRVAYENGSGDAPDALFTYRLQSGSAEPVGDGELLSGFPTHANRGVVPDARANRVAVWDYDKGQIIARPPRQRSRDKDGQFRKQVASLSEDGQLLAQASRDGLVRIWNLETRQLVGEVRAGGVVTAVAFDQQATQLAVGREDGLLLVYQVGDATSAGK